MKNARFQRIFQLITCFSLLCSTASLPAIGLGSDCGTNCCIPEYDPGPLPSPLTLEGAERFAIKHNKSLRALRNTVQGGAWNQYTARSKWAPKISISGEAKRSETATGTAKDAYEQKLSVDQKIYDTATYYGVCDADLKARSLELDLLALTNDVLFDVRSAYYATIIAELEVGVQEENVEILADALRREERKFEVGESTKFQVRQSKVSVANALSSYYVAMRNFKNARNGFLLLLGLEPEDVGEVEFDAREVPIESIEFLQSKFKSIGWSDDATDDEKDDFIAASFRIYSGEETVEDQARIFSDSEVWLWQDRAEQCRPAIKKSCVSLHSASNDLATKRGEWHPTISGFGSVKNASTDRLRFGEDQTSWEYGARVSWTLFDGLGRSFRIKESAAKHCTAMTAYEQALQVARIAIQDRFIDLEESILSYFAASQSVRLAEEAIELAKNRRNLGVITPLEYRDVASSLTSARQTYNRARFTLLRSYYSLRREAGVDVSDDVCLLLQCCE